MRTTNIWIDDSSGEIGIINAGSATVSVIGASGAALTDIAFDSFGHLFGISFTSLYSVNPSTGAATLIGPLVNGNGTMNGLAFSATGTLYASSDTTTSLYTINLATGAATALTGTLPSFSAGDLVFDGAYLYMTDTNGDLDKITISGTSFTASVVGQIGFGNVLGLSLGANGVLYGIAGTELISINPITGAGTAVFDYANHGLTGAYGTATQFVTTAELGGDYGGTGDGDILYRNERSGQLLFELMNAGSPAGTGSATGNLGNYIYGGHGDINGDGFADIVIQNPANGQLLVGYQNGSGTPTYQALPPVPGWRPVGVGDLNGDGFADIVIQNQTSGAIDYYDMHNSSFHILGSVAGCTVVGIGDVNGDGFADIVVQNPAQGIVFYVNMAGGTNSGVMSAINVPGWQVRAVGDLNGDGYADIVIQNLTTGQVSYANMAVGAFNNFVSPTTALSPDFAVKDVVDVNSDGYGDLVLQQQSTGTVDYALQNAGGFASWGGFATGLGADGQVAGNGLSLTHAAALNSDYTGGGTGDVLFRNVSTGQLIFEKMSAGSATGLGLATGPISNFTYGGHGDVNGDGIADVVIQDPSSRRIYVGLEDGSGSGSPGWIAPAAVPGWTVRGVGDVNGDGFADIVIQNDSNGAIYYYDVHDGNFVAAGQASGFNFAGVGDVNGDGYADIVTQNAGTGEIDYINMAGGGTTSINFLANTPGYAVKAVGDLTGAGYADIVIESGSGQTAFLNMQGGTLQEFGTATTTLSSDYQIKDAVDVFNNGHADLVVQQQSTGNTLYAQEGPHGFLQWGTVQTSFGTNWTAV